MAEYFVADIPRNMECDVIVDLAHEPLRQCRNTCADTDLNQFSSHRCKINQSLIYDKVNCLSHQNGNIQRHNDKQKRQQQGSDQ